MTRYFESPCPRCRHSLRVRFEYRGRRVCCTYCGHPFLVSSAYDLLTDGSSQAETDVITLVLQQLQEIRNQFAQLRGEVRDLHDRLDRARLGPASAQVPADAPSFPGRPCADVESPRGRAGRADGLEQDLRAEPAGADRPERELHAESAKADHGEAEPRAARAGVDRLRGEHDDSRAAPAPVGPLPAVAMRRGVDFANASGEEVPEESRSATSDVPRLVIGNGHDARPADRPGPGAPIEENDRSASLLPTFNPELGNRFGAYELPEEVSREGMTAISMARRDEGDDLVDLRAEARVVDGPAGREGPAPPEIPGYQILGKLCDGSMGTLYKARQASVDRVVVVKVLRDILTRKPEFVERFRREARMAARLTHRNIVATIDAGESGGHHYLVMEHLEGETVQDHLDRRRIFDERAALQIALALAEALKHAHERGVVHRDIKPANIVLTREGNVKLIDLGLARLVADATWGATEAGKAIGTPEYISPEQARGQVDVDVRGDIYGLGATLYHMVTGRVPHAGATTPEVLRKHVDVEVLLVPPESINRKLSVGFGAVVKKMMAREREDRYRHPDDLILDLRCVLRGERPTIAQPKPAVPATPVEDHADSGVMPPPPSTLDS